MKTSANTCTLEIQDTLYFTYNTNLPQWTSLKESKAKHLWHAKGMTLQNHCDACKDFLSQTEREHSNYTPVHLI